MVKVFNKILDEHVSPCCQAKGKQRGVKDESGARFQNGRCPPGGVSKGSFPSQQCSFQMEKKTGPFGRRKFVHGSILAPDKKAAESRRPAEKILILSTTAEFPPEGSGDLIKRSAPEQHVSRTGLTPVHHGARSTAAGAIEKSGPDRPARRLHFKERPYRSKHAVCLVFQKCGV